MARAGTPAPGALTETAAEQPARLGGTPVGAARPGGARRDDPISEAAARARERLRHQREIAMQGLEAVAAEGDDGVSLDALAGEELPEPESRPAPVPEAAPAPVPVEPPAPDPVAPPEPSPHTPGQGDIASLRDEVDALRRDLQDAVAQMSRDIERAERVAADRARKEARKQGRKSERAARRAARAAIDAPDDPI